MGAPGFGERTQGRVLLAKTENEGLSDAELDTGASLARQKIERGEEAQAKKKAKAQRRRDIAVAVVTSPVWLTAAGAMAIVWGVKKVGEIVKEDTARVTHYSREFERIANNLQASYLSTIERSGDSPVISFGEMKINGPALPLTQTFKGPPSFESVQQTSGFRKLEAVIMRINAHLAKQGMQMTLNVKPRGGRNPFAYRVSAIIERKK